MKMKRFLAGGVALLMSALLFTPGLNSAAAAEQPVNQMTPYDTYVEPDTFFNGAVLDLKKEGDVHAWITRELENMKYGYNINTLNVYGLEGFDSGDSTENKDFLFKELARLGMKIVVRIESYSNTFAFQVSDLDYVFNTDQKLIEYVCGDGKRQQVAYFSLNMPVDDPQVQQKLEGGINGAQSKERQVSYATAFVKRMRETTASYGFTDAKMYLSIFYGWDNGFQTPSYAPAGADGYFMNNYSYPVNKNNLPDASASGEELINANRLAISLNTYLSQYPGKPLVIESGFHTLEYNNGVAPNQTAGLVKDQAAKIKAMKATMEFYGQYPEFRGWLYFGYNLYKEEGSPPAVMDWSLVYPLEGQAEAETGYRIGGAAAVADTGASGGTAMELKSTGDAIAFYECAALNQIGLTYKASGDAVLGIYIDDEKKQTVELPASDGYTRIFLSQTVVKGANLRFQLESGAVTLDSIGAYPQLEAENSALSGKAQVVDDDAASSGKAVTGLTGEEDTITMKDIRGGARVKVHYRADGDSRIRVTVNGKNSVEIALKATDTYADMSATLNVPAGSTLEIQGISGEGVTLDYVGLSGVPKPEETAPADSSAADGDSGNNMTAIIIVLVCLGVFLIGVVVVTLVILKKK